MWAPPHHPPAFDFLIKKTKLKDARYLCTGSYHDHSTCIDHVAGDRQGDGHSALAAVCGVSVGTTRLYNLGTCQTGRWNGDHSYKRRCSSIVSLCSACVHVLVTLTKEPEFPLTYPAEVQCHLHWQVGIQWSVHQLSELPAGPGHWSVAPVEKHAHEHEISC